LSSCFFNKLDDMVLKFLYPDLTKNVIDFIKKLDDVAERLETRRYDLNKIYKNSLEPYTYHDKIVDLTEEMDTPRDRIKDFLLTKNRFEQIESLEDNFNAAEQLEYENNPIEYYIDASLLKEKIEELLQNLTPKEQKVIKLRFGLADGICYTPEKVSKLLKKSVDEVVRIERKALREIYESWIDYDKLYKTILEEGLLQTLTPLQQDVAKLRFGLVDGICYTKEEICKILNIKEHTVELVSSMVFVKIRDTERFRTFETIHRRF